MRTPKQNRNLQNRSLLLTNFRRGFTLVEMLVVITIIIVLTALTVMLINFSMNSERLGSGSRQVQAFLEGARDRATKAEEPRGVRFLLDNTGNPAGVFTVSSLVYIGPPTTFSEGQIIIENDGALRPRHIRIIGANSNWETFLVDRTAGVIDEATSLLLNGTRVRIGDLNVFYTVVEDSTSPSGWSLTRDYVGSILANAIPIRHSYKLELAPTLLPNEDPAQLPRDIVIDLNGSRVPANWLTNTSRMDVLFSPRGTVIGNAASSGLIHLLLSDRTEVETGLGLGEPDEDLNDNDVLDAGEDANGNGILDRGKAKGEKLVTIVTKTGAINAHHVDATDLVNNTTGALGADGLADDPFRYAETGKEAK